MPSKNSGKCNTLLNWDRLSWGAYFIDVNTQDFGPLNYWCFDFIEILCHFWNYSILFPETLVVTYRIVRVRLLENYYQKSLLGEKCMLMMIFDSYIYIEIYIYRYSCIYRYAYWWLSGKESANNTRDIGNLGSVLGLRLSPGEGNGTHSSILAWRIPQSLAGYRSLSGYSPKGCKELGTSEQPSTAHTSQLSLMKHIVQFSVIVFCAVLFSFVSISRLESSLLSTTI